ncbi:MAG: transposase [Alphaproteobacteria bacterium]
MDRRLFPLTPVFFSQVIEPLILRHYKRPGRPPQKGYYLFFCGVLYVLRTGIPWRDLPACFGPWHTLYTRFKRWRENGLFGSILHHLQQTKRVKVDFT